MEQLVQYATPQQLNSYLGHFRGSYSGLATNRNASHVLDRILQILPKHVEDQELLQKVLELTDELLANVDFVKYNPYGSHVLRKVLWLTGGVVITENQAGVAQKTVPS
jgi:hypothetical protein